MIFLVNKIDPAPPLDVLKCCLKSVIAKLPDIKTTWPLPGDKTPLGPKPIELQLNVCVVKLVQICGIIKVNPLLLAAAQLVAKVDIPVDAAVSSPGLFLSEL